MSSKDVFKYLLPGAVPYATTKATINAVKEKKKAAVYKKGTDKKTSNRAVGGASAIQGSGKGKGHSSRKNKGAASERTGSNASKANTGKGNWI